MDIKIYNDTKALATGFTEFLTLLIGEDNVNICLSGGSTPKAIFDYWAEHCKNSIPWSKINLFWGDVRCVSPTNEMSNYGMTREHLLSKIDIPKENIHRIIGENSPEQEAKRYAELLPSLDLVLLGMGDDGHTASIFPNQIELWDSQEKCVVAKHPDSGMKRISITGQVINQAKYVAFLVTGKGKADKVREIVQNRKMVKDKYPAARVNPTSNNLYWFLDSGAASLIS
jgi:6-phosphogluconolactonase